MSEAEMNRRAFVLSAAAVPVVAVLPAAAVPEFEITRPDPDDQLEVLRRDLLLEMPWQVRWVRSVSGTEYESVMIFRHEPTEADLAQFRQMAHASFDRLLARLAAA